MTLQLPASQGVSVPSITFILGTLYKLRFRSIFDTFLISAEYLERNDLFWFVDILILPQCTKSVACLSRQYQTVIKLNPYI